jgi:hypothetical protein
MPGMEIRKHENPFNIRNDFISPPSSTFEATTSSHSFSCPAHPKKTSSTITRSDKFSQPFVILSDQRALLDEISLSRGIFHQSNIPLRS